MSLYSMKKLKNIFTLGLIAGAISWGVVSIISDRFEPFDSETGYYTGQFILSIIAFWVAYKKRFRDFIIYIIGIYVGMNTYAYIFGGSEQRAWALLAMVTTSILLVYPILCGIIGSILKFLQNKYNNAINQDN